MLAPSSRKHYARDRHDFCCTVRPLFFEATPRLGGNRRGLYAITLESHSRDDKLAQRLTDSVFAGLAIQGHPLSAEPPAVIRFPSIPVGKHRVCSADVLAA
jgi:hypothetical protein